MGIWTVLGIMGLGAALVAWPLLQALKVQRLEAENEDLREKLERLGGTVVAVEQVLEVERDMLDARDLPPGEQLDRLLGSDRDSQAVDSNTDEGPAE